MIVMSTEGIDLKNLINRIGIKAPIGRWERYFREKKKWQAQKKSNGSIEITARRS
jgi:uncharacterized protein YvpB